MGSADEILGKFFPSAENMELLTPLLVLAERLPPTVGKCDSSLSLSKMRVFFQPHGFAGGKHSLTSLTFALLYYVLAEVPSVS